MPEPALIKLTWVEYRAAAQHGLERRLYHCERQSRLRANIDRARMSWDKEINGAVAELAWCKLVDCYWTGLQGTGAQDAGHVEIRSTTRRDTGLPVYEHDKDNTVVAFAQVRENEITFIGYALAAKVKRDEYWRGFEPGRFRWELPCELCGDIWKLIDRVRRARANVVRPDEIVETAQRANGYASGWAG